MICSGAYDADVNAVAFIPTGESVDNVDTGTVIEVVDGPFPVDSPDLMGLL